MWLFVAAGGEGGRTNEATLKLQQTSHVSATMILAHRTVVLDSMINTATIGGSECVDDHWRHFFRTAHLLVTRHLIPSPQTTTSQQ